MSWIWILQLLLVGNPFSGRTEERDFRDWSLEEAVAILNESPWGKQSTFTRVVGGVGSGVSGEKEIFSTFYTRMLSARPIREAFARIHQIQHGYDELGPEEREAFDNRLRPGLELDVRDWVVVAVSFRSNNPDYESRVNRFLNNASVESLKTRAYLSTDRFVRVEIEAYFPPKGDGIGAKFVFPRRIEGQPIASAGESIVLFELEAPVADPELVVSFDLSAMIIDGNLEL